MKTPSLQRFRAKLAADEPMYGLWVTLDSASVTDMAAGLGFDWVVIDAEHGHLDWVEILEHIRATNRSDTVALVRLADGSPDLIKRALDNGADGVVIPRVETAADLQAVVRAARHGPAGTRGISDERATCWGHCFAQHVEESNENVLIIPIIETVRGARNIRELLTVDGVEIFFFDPADYSADAGLPGELEPPTVAAEIDRAVALIRQHGKHAGVVGMTDEALAQYRQRQFRMLGVGFDGGIILGGIRSMLEVAYPGAPGPGRPGSLGGSLSGSLLVPGVSTGTITLAPGATMPCRSQPFDTAVTVLSGRLTLGVESRRHALRAWDNAIVPRGQPHTLTNPSSNEAVVLQVVPAGPRNASNTSEARR